MGFSKMFTQRDIKPQVNFTGVFLNSRSITYYWQDYKSKGREEVAVTVGELKARVVGRGGGIMLSTAPPKYLQLPAWLKEFKLLMETRTAFKPFFTKAVSLSRELTNSQF